MYSVIASQLDDAKLVGELPPIIRYAIAPVPAWVIVLVVVVLHLFGLQPPTCSERPYVAMRRFDFTFDMCRSLDSSKFYV